MCISLSSTKINHNNYKTVSVNCDCCFVTHSHRTAHFVSIMIRHKIIDYGAVESVVSHRLGQEGLWICSVSFGDGKACELSLNLCLDFWKSKIKSLGLIQENHLSLVIPQFCACLFVISTILLTFSTIFTGLSSPSAISKLTNVVLVIGFPVKKHLLLI